MKRTILALLLITGLLLCAFSLAEGDEKAAPLSMGDFLHAYPDSETLNDDGSALEVYKGISQDTYNAFLAFLKDQEPARRARIDEKYETEGDAPVAHGTIKFDKAKAELTYRYEPVNEKIQITYPAGVYDARTRTAREQYQAMVSLTEAGNFDQAAECYMAVSDPLAYAPMKDYVAAHGELSSAVGKYRFRLPGETVTLGCYEQDNNTADGPEPIEWLVLAVQDGKSLLISKYALDTLPYHAEYGPVSWETSSLRAWLNNDFLQAAFAEAEQAAVAVSEVANAGAQESGGFETDGGSNTQDRVFLLSSDEACRYFASEAERLCAATPFAVGKGAWVSPSAEKDGMAAAAWWLRSPGATETCAARVSSDGAVRSSFVDYDEAAVRPVLWIDLDSDIF